MAPDALSWMHSRPEYSLYSTQKEDLELPVTAAVIWEEQHKDTEIAQIFQELAKDDNLLKAQFDVIEDKLYHKTHLSSGQVHFRVYIPRSLISTILQH